MKSLTTAAIAVLAGSHALGQSLVAVDSDRTLYSIDRQSGVRAVIGELHPNVGVPGDVGFISYDRPILIPSISTNVLYEWYEGSTGAAGQYGAVIEMHGIAYQSQTNILYGASNGRIYTINIWLGQATLVGDTGIAGETSLTYDSGRNVMYMSSAATDALYSLNLSNYAPTLIGPLNGPTNPRGLAYGVDDDTIYMVCSDTDTLYTLNRATGAATAISSTGTGELVGITWVMQPPPPPPPGDGDLIAIDSDGLIYGLDRAQGARYGFGIRDCPGRIYELNAPGGMAYSDLGTLYLSSVGGDALYQMNFGSRGFVGFFGDPSISMQSLEWDEATATLYGMSGPDLYTIDAATGVATFIATTGLPGECNLVYDAIRSMMLMTSTATLSLYSLDLATAATTLVGPLNGPLNPRGLAYVPEQDVIFLVCSQTDLLYAVDPQTGVCTLIGSTGSGDFRGLAWVPGGCTMCQPCPFCASDYDNNGGVDGADLGAFFMDFQLGAACADIDRDGGITGADFALWMLYFESGSCDPSGGC